MFLHYLTKQKRRIEGGDALTRKVRFVRRKIEKPRGGGGGGGGAAGGGRGGGRGRGAAGAGLGQLRCSAQAVSPPSLPVDFSLRGSQNQAAVGAAG